MLRKMGREGRDVMEASPFFICCFPLSEHHCSSDDEFGFHRTRTEKALWESYSEPRYVSPCWSQAGVALTVCKEEPWGIMETKILSPE